MRGGSNGVYRARGFCDDERRKMARAGQRDCRSSGYFNSICFFGTRDWQFDFGAADLDLFRRRKKAGGSVLSFKRGVAFSCFSNPFFDVGVLAVDKSILKFLRT